MYISLVSTLSLKECVSRLENERERDETSLSFEYDTVRCEVEGENFTLKKRRAYWMPYMYGELSEASDGTVITYTMQISPFANRLQSTWLVLLSPFLACFLVGLVFDAFENGLTLKMSFAFVAALSLPVMFYLRKQFADKQAERDKKEMLEFLQKVLSAKPRFS